VANKISADSADVKECAKFDNFIFEVQRLLTIIFLVSRISVSSGKSIGRVNRVKLLPAQLVVGFGDHLQQVYHPNIFPATQAHLAWPSLHA